MIKSVEWTGISLRIIDQTEIPRQLVYRELTTIEEVFEAIQKLQVRGAPAIGVAAAFGLYLGMKNNRYHDKKDFLSKARSLSEYLAKARPTAVNLNWALQVLLEKISAQPEQPPQLIDRLLEFSLILLQDDQERCQKIADHGSRLIKNGMVILTHCNAGALATTGIGTALGILHTAWQMGKKFEVMVSETRPLLQGARLTMWELQQRGIPAILITDNMAAYAMQLNKIDLVLVGADRIAANGDVANKIGTYNLAVISNFHKVPLYVAAPLSSFDLSLSVGGQIPVEEREPEEITQIWKKLSITIPEARCWNPAFDITPADLITGIISERGIIYPPLEDSIKRLNSMTYQNQEVSSL
jgi:methylthioribose-1-phosphate isomerase